MIKEMIILWTNKLDTSVHKDENDCQSKLYNLHTKLKKVSLLLNIALHSFVTFI